MNNLSSLDEISQYRLSNPEAYLILDTNVLLLLFVGAYDKNYLVSCPLMTDNGRNYGVEHFGLIQKILARFVGNIVITPHILSEANMLSRKRIKSPHLNDYLKKMIEQLEKCKEHPVELKRLLCSAGILEFGFSDISLIEAAKEKKWIILTDEFPLYRNFNQKVPIIYFSSVVAKEIQCV